MGKDFDIEKLRGSENYHMWRFAVENVLAFKGLSDCIKSVTTVNDDGAETSQAGEANEKSAQRPNQS